MTVEVSWRLPTNQTQQRGSQIHEVYQPFGLDPWRVFCWCQVSPFFGEVDNHGHMQARIKGPAFATGETGTVIRKEEDDGVF